MFSFLVAGSCTDDTRCFLLSFLPELLAPEVLRIDCPDALLATPSRDLLRRRKLNDGRRRREPCFSFDSEMGEREPSGGG